MSRKTVIALALAFTLVIATFAFRAMAQTDSHMTMAAPQMTPTEMKWGPAPPGLPKGGELTVLSGDPGKEGAEFTVRLKAPAGYKIMPHFHPTDENLTIISGTFVYGMGDKFDEKTAKAYPAGSFVQAPAKMHHYAMCKGPTVVQIHAIGPFAITYVNAADDPRNTAAPASK